MSSDVPGWNEPEYPPTPPPPSLGAAGLRVKAPAVFVIILGVVNLLGACFTLIQGLSLQAMDQEAYNKQQEQAYKMLSSIFKSPEFEKALKETDQEQAKAQSTTMALSTGTLLLVAGALMIFGGIRMFLVRSYGLAVVASILTAVPCLSCSACCGLGEGIGIWSLVVLLNPDVRAAFR
jgi:hypothetical protein